MDHLFDEFSKSLSESLPRRESLRRLGAVIAGAVLSPLRMETAWAKGVRRSDPCIAFCKCRNNKQQRQCLEACRGCQSDTSRVCGSCGNYVCCAAGLACCNGFCADLQSEVYNCGGCGRQCAAPGANQLVACVSGVCTYACVPDPRLTNCSGLCTDVRFDSSNCGACGNVCADSAPTCDQGTCTSVVCPGGGKLCFGTCTNVSFDTVNCGACGIVCDAGQTCLGGICQYVF
jgi:hypothetical protein